MNRHVVKLLCAALVGCGAPMRAPSDGGADAREDAVDVQSEDAAADQTSPDVTSADVALSACGSCAAYGSVTDVGAAANRSINELSGLAASRIHEGIYWAHNDSGDSARVFALRESGEDMGVYTITGATAEDWEDIAVGPCAGATGSCIFVADMGDNAEFRTNTVIYRMPEPATLAAAASIAAERFPFRYADGAHNAEAFIVDPSDGARGYILSKTETGTSTVFRLSLTAADVGVMQTATRIGMFAVTDGVLTQVTAADAHPCEPKVLVRTYDRLFELRAPAGGSLEAAFAAPLVRVSVAGERQGEAVAYRANGRGYVTASEGASPHVSLVQCR